MRRFAPQCRLIREMAVINQMAQLAVDIQKISYFRLALASFFCRFRNFWEALHQLWPLSAFGQVQSILNTPSMPYQYYYVRCHGYQRNVPNKSTDHFFPSKKKSKRNFYMPTAARKMNSPINIARSREASQPYRFEIFTALTTLRILMFVSVLYRYLKSIVYGSVIASL